LAHVNKDRTESAYARSDLLERRRELMTAWAEHCIPASKAASSATKAKPSRKIADLRVSA
jgi:hypothetical protein